MVSKTLVLFIILLFSVPCYSDDYFSLLEGNDIQWDITPSELIDNCYPNIDVLWFGKMAEISVTSTPDGNAEVLWFFSQHSFINPGPNALIEPFQVKEESSGYFLFTIIFPYSKEKTEREHLNEYKNLTTLSFLVGQLKKEYSEKFLPFI